MLFYVIDNTDIENPITVGEHKPLRIDTEIREVKDGASYDSISKDCVHKFAMPVSEVA